MFSLKKENLTDPKCLNASTQTIICHFWFNPIIPSCHIVHSLVLLPFFKCSNTLNQMLQCNSTGSWFVSSLRTLYLIIFWNPYRENEWKQIWKIVPSLLCSNVFVTEVRKTIHVQQVLPASMLAIIIFAKALIIVYSSSLFVFCVFTEFFLPERSCLIRPLLLLMSTGRKSLNQEISGSGFPLAAQSMVAVRVRSTTFSCGPMSMVGKPWGIWSSGKHTHTQPQRERHQHTWLNCMISSYKCSSAGPPGVNGP